MRLALISATTFTLTIVPLLAACHPASPPEDRATSAPIVRPQYILSGGISHPGARLLRPGDTVATVLARDYRSAPGKPTTLVLIRQAPEGKTKQLIMLNASGELVNPEQNYALRNGDELQFPGALQSPTPTGGGAAGGHGPG